MMTLFEDNGGDAEFVQVSREIHTLLTLLTIVAVLFPQLIDRSKYGGTSLLWSPMGLCKSDLNGEVTVLQGLICTVEFKSRADT